MRFKCSRNNKIPISIIFDQNLFCVIIKCSESLPLTKSSWCTLSFRRYRVLLRTRSRKRPESPKKSLTKKWRLEQMSWRLTQMSWRLTQMSWRLSARREGCCANTGSCWRAWTLPWRMWSNWRRVSSHQRTASRLRLRQNRKQPIKPCVQQYKMHLFTLVIL